jgi:riboflavin biosynthesis pyrimidine reductase
MVQNEMISWQKVYDKFALSKVSAARSAEIPGFTTIEDNTLSFPWLEGIASPWTNKLYNGPFFSSPSPDPKLPSVNLVFVQSSNGNTGADNPGDLGGGETDKHLMYEGLARVKADAVMAGAETVRGSGLVFSLWHPNFEAMRKSFELPKHPIQIVATQTGRIDMNSEMIFNLPFVQVCVLTTDLGAGNLKEQIRKRPWVKIISGSGANLTDGLRRLKTDYGIKRISAVGGRKFATALIDENLVADLYLTTSPINGGQRNTPFYPKPLRKTLVVKKLGNSSEKGVIFEHFVLR